MAVVKKEVAFRELLDERFIELDLREDNKKKLLVSLVDILARSRKLRDKKEFLKTLLEREKLGSTGIGNGVAIPHGKSDKVSGFALAIGRHLAGIEFGALDGEKTHMFFILASPKEATENHLKLLAQISRLVKDKFIVDKLRAASSKKDIIKIITAFGT